MQGFALDITERKRAEQRSLVFASLGRQLSTAANPKEAAELIARVADELLGWDAFALSLCDAATMRRILFYDIIDGARTELALVTVRPLTATDRAVLAGGAQLVLRSTYDGSAADCAFRR